MSTASPSADPPTTSVPASTVWPVLNYRDAPAAIRFLVDAFGFREVAAYPGDDPGTLVHAELAWPLGGGVMLGSATAASAEFADRPTGVGSCYVVTDEPDALLDRAAAAGATVVRGLRDEDHGSRGFTAADPEGNLWSFGTYRGEGAAT